MPYSTIELVANAAKSVGIASKYIECDVFKDCELVRSDKN